MKTLVPVDESDAHKAVFDCLQSLQPPNLQVGLIHAVAPVPSTFAVYPELYAYDTGTLTETLRSGARKLLNRAYNEAKDRGLRCEEILVNGYPSSMIADTATVDKYDLIAIGSEPKGEMTRLFGGSVALNLATGAEQSVLIVRSHHHPKGPFTAVFATDHSEYSNSCLEKLLNWNFGGLTHIEVLTAYQVSGDERLLASNSTVIAEDEVDKLIEERLCEKTESVAEKIRQKGISASATVAKADVHDAIRSTMVARGAKLLILGAKGHGLWKRVLLGSTAIHQVVGEPHSILIVRA
ncbi:MAG TPA: universal stress protein [Fimbriimonas sp.]|nr:universal stress protein [Fimbriimonas sp.]